LLSEIKAISGKRMCRLLKEKGWNLARVTGSHHIFVREGANLRITIPVHANQNLKTGLQRAIMKLADIAENEL
jgi:predicted RNA binding protein YcfA (HicA-like mRNA interferase family)